MTRTQQVIWTPLPNGLSSDGKKLRISVLVSPRLVTDNGADEPLKAFPDFLNWADRISRARFAIEFAGLTVRAELETAPEPDVYARLFGPATVVRSHRFEDKRSTSVLTSPSLALASDLAELYGDVSAAASDELPSRLFWHQKIGNVGKTGDASPEILLRMLRARRSGERGLAPLDATVTGRFALHDVYNSPLSARTTARRAKSYDPTEDVVWETNELAPLPDPAQYRDIIDFHRMVGMLSQHPPILLATGFRVDLTVDRNALPATATDRLVLNVRWPHGDEVQTLPDSTPGVQTVLDRNRFMPAPRAANDPLVVDGFARLGARAGPIEVDVNGSVLKVRQFAINIANTPGRELERGNGSIADLDPAGPEPDRAGAPALRSGGLTLADDLRGEALETAFDAAASLQSQHASSAPITLYQEDLLRGLRAEVADGDGPWQSLCRRTSLYHFVSDGSTRQIADNEGVIRVGAGGSADGSIPDVLKVDAAIFSWSGWSLVAPRPGRAIDTSDRVADAESLSPPGLPLEVEHQAQPGSLPSLRFGRRYRVRLRAVDLAGNGRAWDKNAKSPAGVETAPTIYRRFEPIEAPIVAMVGPPTMPPPSLGEGLSVLAIRSLNSTEPDNEVPTTEQSERHLVPPAGSQRLAELHGMLDVDGKLDPASFTLLATRDRELGSISTDKSEDQLPVGPVTFELPYLPDPLAHSCVVRVAGFGKTPPIETRVPLYRSGKTWPDASAFRVQLVEGANEVTFNATTRVLTVALRKGEHVRARVSHALNDDDLPLMGVLQWGFERCAPAARGALQKRALGGHDWMLTPWRDLDLVHAVQRPLVRPAIEQLQISRPLASTKADLAFSTPIDTLSTERLDVSATWLDPRDDPEEPAPQWIAGSGHAARLKLARLSAPGFAPPGHKSFGKGDDAQQVFADTRYRRVGYLLTATTRFTSFLPDPLRDPDHWSDLTVTSEETVGFVPNSAPPPAPDIVYVIPTFGWTRRSVSGEQRSYRDGGGLRVYLRRPWLVTGAMEMLAVVLPPGGLAEADVDERLNKLVTRWGSDPTVPGAGLLHGSPTRGQFGLAVTSGPIARERLDTVFPPAEGELPPGPFHVTDLPLPGAPAGTRVDVAPHLVAYDPDRELWFADIVVDAGAQAMPLIQLALARYQPISSEGAHLSSAVRCEVLQLTNDRLAIVTRKGARTYRVTLYGEALATGLSRARFSPVELIVEQLGAGDDEDFGWHALTGIKLRDAAPPPRRPSGSTRAAAAARPSAAAVAATRSMLLNRDYAGLLKDRSAISALMMPEIIDKELVLPRSPGLGERFRLVISEHEPRSQSSGHKILEEETGLPRTTYLEMFPLDE
ncbi:hypothetical protein GCM10022276_12300 [Sphingomonas limnosediminicola]|uniref:Baseplate protein J-like domain-containing protein n=1 Tax=Sphingomonas limnosediminicola TaxID=940133 RepID=A0ABP7L659_9SPHN